MCGILGMVSKNREVAKDLYVGLYALQHRGKESAGIVTTDGQRYYSHRDMGEVAIVFRENVLEELLGNCGLAQNRYSTKGASDYINMQPIQGFYKGEEFWLVHNGNLVNAESLKQYCLKGGYSFLDKDTKKISDTYAIVAFISLSRALSFEKAVKAALRQLRGAFSIIILHKGRIIVARDTLGIRPLQLGKRKDEWIVASETCIFDHLGAKYIREIKPGEMSIIDKNGISLYHQFPSPSRKFCIFEFIYFLRPDSLEFGRRVDACRERMGKYLAQEHPVEKSFFKRRFLKIRKFFGLRPKNIIGIPFLDSGLYVGRGFNKEAGINSGENAVFRLHNVSRTFIEPVQELRERGVELKFNIIPERVANKRVYTEDDSTVRGTTGKKMTRRLRAAGAKEVHHRSGSPPYRYPCYYGIDTYRIENELIAARHNGDVEKIREEMGVDSLGYLSLRSVIRAIIEIAGKPLTENDFCTACFTGEYPIEPPREN